MTSQDKKNLLVYSTSQTTKKSTNITFSLHIHIKCALHTNRLSRFETWHPSHFWGTDASHTLPRGLLTFSTAETDAKVKLQLLMILQNRRDVTSKFYEYSDTWHENVLHTGE